MCIFTAGKRGKNYASGACKMEKLLEILSSIRSDVDFANEENLVDGGILDSFDIVAIVGELCDAYDISMSVDDLEPVNFNSTAAILALVERILDQA